LLIDSNWLSQHLPGNRDIGQYPRIEQSYLGKQADVVTADLTSVYGDQLLRYERTLVSIKHGPLIVLDQLRSSEAHRYAVLWHPLQSVTSQSREQASFVMTRSQTNKSVRVIGNGQVELSRFDGPLPLNSYTLAETKIIERPVVMQFATSAPQREATFVTFVGDPDAAERMRWIVEGRSLDIGSGALDLLGNDGVAISLKDKGTVFLNITDYSRTNLSIHATAPISGELVWSNTGDAELTLDATVTCDVRLDGLVGENGEKNKLHLERGRNIFRMHRGSFGH
jgi:hypothetical protein